MAFGCNGLKQDQGEADQYSKLLRFHAIRNILGEEKSMLSWEVNEALAASG